MFSNTLKTKPLKNQKIELKDWISKLTLAKFSAELILADVGKKNIENSREFHETVPIFGKAEVLFAKSSFQV